MPTGKVLTNFFILLFVFLNTSLFASSSTFNYVSEYNIVAVNQNINQDNSKTLLQEEYDHLADYNHEHDKQRYIFTAVGVTTGFMLVGAGILYALPEEFTNWSKEDLSSDIKNLPSKWRDNVRQGPVWDKDDLFLNYVTHPYWGAVYYMQARNAGYGRFGSFMFSTIMSTFFWEYGIEAFAEVPSIQDLIVTPVAGSLIGEVFYIQSNKIKANNYEVLNSRFLGYTSLILMDPGFALMELTSLHKYVETNNDGSYTSFGVGGNGRVALNMQFQLKNKSY